MSEEKNIEQRRRDLLACEPDLYHYIRHFESAKVLDHAGDLAGEKYSAVANQLYALKGVHNEACRGARGEQSRTEARDT